MGSQTGGQFSVGHDQLPPRTLAAPMLRHHREDQYSYVLSGSLGALLGDVVVRCFIERRSGGVLCASQDGSAGARADASHQEPEFGILGEIGLILLVMTWW